MGKVKMKLKCLYPPPVEVEILRELCDMRESPWQDVFTTAELECLRIFVQITWMYNYMN